MNRQIAFRALAASLMLAITSMLNFGCTSPEQTYSDVAVKSENVRPESAGEKAPVQKDGKVKIFYLEIVTPDTDAAIALYSKMYGVKFGDPDQKLGGARTAKLEGGGMLAVRGPLRKTEKPVVRPYVLVKDIKKSVAAASKGGAVVAMAPTEIKGYGQFSIVIHGGIESGLWQN